MFWSSEAITFRSISSVKKRKKELGLLVLSLLLIVLSLLGGDLKGRRRLGRVVGVQITPLSALMTNAPSPA